MTKMHIQGTSIGGRYVLERLLGTGAIGAVWGATDLQTKRPCIVKVFPEESQNPALPSYQQHLEQIYRQLADQEPSGVDLPIDYGFSGTYFYEVFRHRENVRTLTDVIADLGPMDPKEALDILAQVAQGLSELHRRSIIHCDIKPSNILVVQNGTPRVFLTDLGMARVIEAEKGILVFGTARYMHPDLLRVGRSSEESDFTRIIIAGKAVGPYIDLYSLGVVAIAMLTGTLEIPEPLTPEGLLMLLYEKNHRLRASIRPTVQRVADLIFAILTVRAATSGVTAETVRSGALTLMPEFETEGLISEEPLAPHLTKPAADVILQLPEEFQAVLRKIEGVAHDLLTSTGAFLSRAEALETVPNKDQEENIVAEVGAVFTNALRRTQTSWRLSLLITIISFAIIAIMIVTALVLSVQTGKSQWALVFGGLSVPMIIGTLIWKPYDRLFRATILSQEIEMIHVRTLTGFRGTLDHKERMRIFEEGFIALQTVFREHASGK